MPNFNRTLLELREERNSARSRVESLDSAISTLEGLLQRGAGKARGKRTGAGRAVSAAARRRMAQAQRTRWAKAREGSQLPREGKSTTPVPARRNLSLAARRKIADAQKARWARVRAQQTTKAA